VANNQEKFQAELDGATNGPRRGEVQGNSVFTQKIIIGRCTKLPANQNTDAPAEPRVSAAGKEIIMRLQTLAAAGGKSKENWDAPPQKKKKKKIPSTLAGAFFFLGESSVAGGEKKKKRKSVGPEKGFPIFFAKRSR